MRNRERRFRTDEAGLSEIVGALMLILIVALAASSLALFVQDQQREAQEQESLAQEAALEDLAVARVRPLLATGTDPQEWQHLNFTISSQTVLPVQVFQLSLNGAALEEFDLERYDRESKEWIVEPMDHTSTLSLEPREQVRVAFDVPAGLFGDDVVLASDPLVLEVLTVRGHTFEGVFLPPTAVPLVQVESVFNGTGYEDHALLDGRLSDHPSEEARIVRWNWTWDDGTNPPEQAVGRVVRAFGCDGTTSYDVTLEVVDNFGLVARRTIDEFTC